MPKMLLLIIYEISPIFVQPALVPLPFRPEFEITQPAFPFKDLSAAVVPYSQGLFFLGWKWLVFKAEKF